jgi:nitric oxide reductase NorD protein
MAINIFEPEETVGKLWDRLISRPTDLPRWPEAAVTFADMQGRLGVFFRALGGDPGIDLKATPPRTTGTRLGLFHRLGHDSWQVPRARIDGDTLLLPDVLDILPETGLNADLYFWLTAWAAAVEGEWPRSAADPLQADIEALRFARRIVQRTLAIAPGLRERHARLCHAALQVRPARRLPPAEAAVEEAIRWLLRAGAGETPQPSTSRDNPVLAAVLDEDTPLESLVAPPRYRTFLPVPLWGDALPRPERAHSPEREDAAGTAGAREEEEEDRKYRGRRRRSDEAEKKDPLILNRFEHILALAEFFNLNRLVDDEDSEENARKARDDLDEISLVDVKKKPKTRLRFDLDLSPEDVELERLAAEHVYPEWDYRRRDYLPDHCRVLMRTAEEAREEDGPRAPWRPDEATRRRIRAVRRQFEALRPKREILRRQMDGTDFDTDALVRSVTDLVAHGEGSDRIYLQAREVSRDLAVAVLFDTSRSTESWVEGRQVIDIAREALTALTEGLAACGDDYAIYAFSSIRRHRVYVNVIKGFDEPRSAAVHRRIAALRPGFYTRLGAAIRHVSRELRGRPNSRRLLLVITDGKPNDLDHYEGRYGVEDTARAIMEARREGLRVFGVTIDSKAQAYFPYIFGRNAYAIVSRPARLTAALPRLYRHLVA